MSDEQGREPTPPRKRRFGTSRLLDSYLDSPLSGLAPWILVSVLGGPGRFGTAIAIVFGLTLFTVWAGHRRGDRMHSLTVFGAAYFGVLLVIRALTGSGADEWLGTWTGEMSNIALAVFAIGTLLIRRPFTMSYAKETTPEELWDAPGFMRINFAVSAVWAASFAFAAVVGFIGIVWVHDSDNFWTAWVLQLAATFFALAFTGTYPDYAGLKWEREQGLSTEPLPSLLPIVDWLPSFAITVGILGLVIDEVPQWLGITLIVVGALSAIVVRRISPPAGRESPA
jgi:hypothetical protein